MSRYKRRAERLAATNRQLRQKSKVPEIAAQLAGSFTGGAVGTGKTVNLLGVVDIGLNTAVGLGALAMEAFVLPKSRRKESVLMDVGLAFAAGMGSADSALMGMAYGSGLDYKELGDVIQHASRLKQAGQLDALVETAEEIDGLSAAERERLYPSLAEVEAAEA